jgi:pyrroline-5-carboxylate reductase
MTDLPQIPALPLLARIWLVGCGQMGGALLDRWLGAGLDPAAVTVIDPAPRSLPEATGLRHVAAPRDAGASPSLIVLGIKPQTLGDLARLLAPCLAGDGPRPVLLSMLAGVRTQTLASLFPGLVIARMMPNLPARIGAGATVLHAPAVPADAQRALEVLLSQTGQVFALEDESRFDAVTALSGSGPAFLCRFVEAMGAAGEAAGLDREMAQALALQTVVGTAALLTEVGTAPATLRQQVTSPQGTTEAGLDVLDGDGALSTLLRATVRAAAERSRALALAAEAAVDFPPREPARAAG